jgi:hypothetical protein
MENYTKKEEKMKIERGSVLGFLLFFARRLKSNDIDAEFFGIHQCKDLMVDGIAIIEELVNGMGFFSMFFKHIKHGRHLSWVCTDDYFVCVTVFKPKLVKFQNDQ